MTDLPAPPVPPECDLRSFEFMPLDVKRLRDSDLAATTDAEQFRAAVLLWSACWHQVPASSVPDDDQVLANLAGFGRDVKAWKKVRAAALRGFVKASDGRLYHSLIAKKAAEAWESRVEYRANRESERDRKRLEREERSALAKTLKAHGIVFAWNAKLTDMREAVRNLSAGQVQDRPAPVPAKRERGTGKGTERVEAKAVLPTQRASVESNEPQAAGARALDEQEKREAECIAALRAGGHDVHVGDARVTSAVAAGVDGRMLVAICKEKQGRGLPYVLKTAVGRISDRANGPNVASTVEPARAKVGVDRSWIPEKPADPSRVEEGMKELASLLGRQV